MKMEKCGLVKEEQMEEEKKKTYAKIKCGEVSCHKCPMVNTHCRANACKTLQEVLNTLELDDEEREFYQKRIDREYKEE